MADQSNIPSLASYWPGVESSTDEAPYKRTRKTKKDLIKCYDTRMQMSRTWREDQYDKTWKRLIELYKGKHFQGTSSANRIAVNVSFATVNVIVPSVAVNHPQITVDARSPDLEENAYVTEAAVNYWWRHYDWRDEVKRAVKDSLVIGHGWIKVGWKYAEKQVPVPEEQRQQQYSELSAQTDQFAQENPHLADQLPSGEDIHASLPDTQSEVQHDKPTVERVSPFDIYIDPEATSPADLKWIAQKIVAPVERVKNDSRYSATARNKLKADMSANPRWRDDENANAQNQKRNDDIQRVTIYEYWDIEHQFYCVFSKGSEDFLLEPTDFPYDFGIPFIPLLNYEVPDQFYSVGDLEMLEPMQHELNAVRSDMMNHRKRWQRAYVALRDKFDPEAQAVLASDKDGRIAWVDGDEPLANLIQPIPQVPLDPQMYQYSDQIENDLELVSGISEYQRGSAPETRRTATEASMIQDATNARVSDKLAQVEIFMGAVAECVVQLAQQFLTSEEVARIVGPDGKAAWVQFTREDIEGEYDFTVEAGSTQPKNENFKRQQALNLAQTLQPFVGVPGGVDPSALVQWILKDGFGIKDPTPFIMKADPNAQQQETPKVIENLNYKDLPADIQRQVEQAAGFQPSQMGGVSPHELADSKVQGTLTAQEQAAGHQLDHHDQQAQDEMLKQYIQSQTAHDNSMQQADQQAAHGQAATEQQAKLAPKGKNEKGS